MFSRIVVPLDGSDVAEQALAPAADLARRLGVPLHLIRITDMAHADVTAFYGYMVDSSAVAKQLRDEVILAREYLDENARGFIDTGLMVSTQVEVGLAAAELVRAMREGDLCVIASHGRSGIARWYMGSVAEQVMRQASVPVMVVRGQAQSNRNSHPTSGHLLAS